MTVVIVARLTFVLGEPERQPDLGLDVHDVYARRHDTDDLTPAAVDVDADADDRPPTEDGLPQSVRDQRHRRWRTNACVVAGKQAAVSSLHTQGVEQVGVDDRRADAERAIACHEIGFVDAKRADVDKRAVELPKFQVLRDRRRELRKFRQPRGQIISSAGWGYASGRRSTALTTEKMAVFAPIPRAMVRTTIVAKMGVRRIARSA